MNLFLAIIAAILVSASAVDDYLGPYASYPHRDDGYTPESDVTRNGQLVKLWGFFTPGAGCPRESADLYYYRVNVFDKGSAKGNDYVDEFKERFDHQEQCNAQNNLDGLSSKGVLDIIAITERLKTGFPDFFATVEEEEDTSKLIFASDGSSLCEQSRNLFLLATVSDDLYEFYEDNNKPDSLIFTLTEQCNLMKSSLADNSTMNDALYELEHTYSASSIQSAVRAISTFSGIRFDMHKAKIIYDALGSEMAAYESGISIWRHILNNIELLEILEYMKDLELYYTSGYAIEQNYKPICLVYKEMIDAFENVQSGPNGVFYFGSREILLRMLSYLQLYKDVTGLRADYIDPNRQWRSKNIAEFSSNIVSGLFLGTDGIHYVVFYHQEREVPIPGCGPPCTFQKFKELYGDPSKCVFEELCGAA